MDFIPCEFCEELIPFENYNQHVNTICVRRNLNTLTYNQFINFMSPSIFTSLPVATSNFAMNIDENNEESENTNTETTNGTNIEINTETNNENNTETSIDINPETNIETDTNTNMETDSATNIETITNTDSDSNITTESNIETPEQPTNISQNNNTSDTENLSDMFLYNTINNFSSINNEYINSMVNNLNSNNSNTINSSNIIISNPPHGSNNNSISTNGFIPNSEEILEVFRNRLNRTNTQYNNLGTTISSNIIYYDLVPNTDNNIDNNDSDNDDNDSDNDDNDSDDSQDEDNQGENSLGSIIDNINININDSTRNIFHSIINQSLNNINSTPTTYEEYSNLQDVEVGVSKIENICQDFVLQSNFECVVCREDFKEGDTIKKTNCGHLFCTSCIKTWFASNKKCPVCNHEFD